MEDTREPDFNVKLIRTPIPVIPFNAPIPDPFAITSASSHCSIASSTARERGMPARDSREHHQESFDPEEILPIYRCGSYHNSSRCGCCIQSELLVRFHNVCIGMWKPRLSSLQERILLTSLISTSLRLSSKMCRTVRWLSVSTHRKNAMRCISGDWISGYNGWIWGLGGIKYVGE